MGFVAHWIPAVGAGLLLSVTGLVLRARLRHNRRNREAATLSKGPLPASAAVVLANVEFHAFSGTSGVGSVVVVSTLKDLPAAMTGHGASRVSAQTARAVTLH